MRNVERAFWFAGGFGVGASEGHTLTFILVVGAFMGLTLWGVLNLDDYLRPRMERCFALWVHKYYCRANGSSIDTETYERTCNCGFKYPKLP